MAGRVANEVVLSDEERAFLQTQVRRHKAARSLSDRCRMILLCAEGLQSKEVGERLGVHEHTVGKWRRRFVRSRTEGLTDEYRPGRPRTERGFIDLIARPVVHPEADVLRFRPTSRTPRTHQGAHH